ncbi:baseplate megatron protein TIM-barrel domain-containing protein [Brevundimonas terrae]|uniref:baseplate megatron protein TIM-barrel domain-containing protein n=1 Tax=Brevundimonas terrae TaxID=363631 RepID=UPI003C7CC4A7
MQGLCSWRGGDSGLDGAVFAWPQDGDYQVGQVAGGRDFDWYYTSAEDEAAQVGGWGQREWHRQGRGLARRVLSGSAGALCRGGPPISGRWRARMVLA